MQYENPNTLSEILRLTKENNEMLHSMRRNAVLGNFLKFVIYAIIFAAPVWFYMTYISASVDKFVAAVNQLEGTQQAAQQKYGDFQDELQQLEAHLPAFLQRNAASGTSAQ